MVANKLNIGMFAFCRVLKKKIYFPPRSVGSCHDCTWRGLLSSSVGSCHHQSVLVIIIMMARIMRSYEAILDCPISVCRSYANRDVIHLSHIQRRRKKSKWKDCCFFVKSFSHFCCVIIKITNDDDDVPKTESDNIFTPLIYQPFNHQFYSFFWATRIHSTVPIFAVQLLQCGLLLLPIIDPRLRSNLPF